MSEPDLKPCPFCGGQAHIMKMGYPHWVLCKQCGAKVHGGKFGEKEGEAASIEAWNRRTSYSCDHEKDHTADTGKKVCVDAISRQAALDMLDEQIELCNKALSAFDISLKDEYAVKVEKASLKAYKEQLENLPSAQPEPDCVSRKTALDAFGLSEKTRKYGGDHSGYDTRMLYEIQDTLEYLPAVQPERKKGNWVTVDRCYVKCSECGLETTKNELRGIALFGENEPYFCPNCGADMRKENES